MDTCSECTIAGQYPSRFSGLFGTEIMKQPPIPWTVWPFGFDVDRNLCSNSTKTVRLVYGGRFSCGVTTSYVRTPMVAQRPEAHILQGIRGSQRGFPPQTGFSLAGEAHLERGCLKQIGYCLRLKQYNIHTQQVGDNFPTKDRKQSKMVHPKSWQGWTCFTCVYGCGRRSKNVTDGKLNRCQWTPQDHWRV